MLAECQIRPSVTEFVHSPDKTTMTPEIAHAMMRSKSDMYRDGSSDALPGTFEATAIALHVGITINDMAGDENASSRIPDSTFGTMGEPC